MKNPESRMAPFSNIKHHSPLLLYVTALIILVLSASFVSVTNHKQPFLMGENAVAAMDRHLHGLGVEKVQQVGVLPVSRQNLDELLPLIRRNVLGQRGKD